MADIFALPLIQALGLTLLHFLWQGSIVGMVLFVLLCVFRKPQLRYVASCLLLLVLAVLPVGTFATIYEAPQKPETLTPVNVARSPEVRVEETTPAPVIKPARQPAQTLLNTSRLTVYLPWLVVTWFIGALIFSGKLLLSFLTLQRFRRKGVRLAEQGLQLRLLEFARRLNVKQKITLLESKLVPVPIVLGWLRPVILLPASAVSGLSPKQLEMLLAHELAHVLRRDYLVNILQSVLESLLFYHPVVWWVSAQIRKEREYCCDDIAVSLTGNAQGYARTLLTLAEMRVSLAPSANGGQLFTRVSRLLQPLETDMKPSYIFAGLSSLGVLVALFLTVVNVSVAQEDKAELWVTVVGDVTFSEDYSEITRMAPDAFVVFEERNNAESKKVRIQSISANDFGVVVSPDEPDSSGETSDNTLQLEMNTHAFMPETVVLNSRDGSLNGYISINGNLNNFDEAALAWYKEALKASILNITSQLSAKNEYTPYAQTFDDEVNNRTVHIIYEPAGFKNNFVALTPPVWEIEPPKDELLRVYRDNIRYQSQRYSAGLLTDRSFAGYLDGLSASPDFLVELFPNVVERANEIKDVALRQQLIGLLRERSKIPKDETKQLLFVNTKSSIDMLSGQITSSLSPDGKNRISGKVTTDKGDPVSFGVVFIGHPLDAKVDPGVVIGQTGTNKAGEFSFNGFGIPSGDYVIWVESSNSFESMFFVPLTVNKQELEVSIRVTQTFNTLSPTPGATVSTTPTLSWEAVPDAVRYLVMVGDPVTNEEIVYQITDATNVTIELPLEANRNYSWSVGAYSKNGRQINAAYGDVFKTE